MRKKKSKKPDCFMLLRCDERFKSVLKVEANAEGRTLTNYVFELVKEARNNRQIGAGRNPFQKTAESA